MLACLVLLPACSVSVKPRDTLSASALEGDIGRDLAHTYGIPAPLVHCPSHVPAKKGARARCTTELDGQSVEITVLVTSPHGGAELRPTSAVVAKGKAESQLGASLGRRGLVGAEVFCAGPALLVVKPGHSFTCSADAAGVQRQLVVTVTDLSGMLSYRVLPYKGSAA